MESFVPQPGLYFAIFANSCENGTFDTDNGSNYQIHLSQVEEQLIMVWLRRIRNYPFPVVRNCIADKFVYLYLHLYFRLYFLKYTYKAHLSSNQLLQLDHYTQIQNKGNEGYLCAP